MTITFVANTYQRGQLLQRLINSLIAQTDGDWELFIEDEGEQDLSAYNTMESRILLIGRLPSTHDWGYTAANYLVRNYVTNDYVVFCSEDDIFMPELVSELHNAIREQQPDVILYNMYHRKIYPNGEVFVTAPLIYNVDKCSFCIRRQFFIDVGGFDQQQELADGMLFQRINRSLGSNYRYVKIDKVLTDKE
jgi:GT2 family glycosyltransferase